MFIPFILVHTVLKFILSNKVEYFTLGYDTISKYFLLVYQIII